MERNTEITYVPLVKMTMVKERELPYAMEEITRPEKVAAFVREFLSGTDREHMLVLSIGLAGRLAAIEVVGIGAMDKVFAEPREIFKHAILTNASGIVMAHNHTSGRCVPSREDFQATDRIDRAGKLLGIPLLDHVIVGDEYFSFREEKILTN